jgi:hypothetical protein
MTKLTLEQQELLFANDCKLINLRYEYHGYTGTEKWAIVTELADELRGVLLKQAELNALLEFGEAEEEFMEGGDDEFEMG